MKIQERKRKKMRKKMSIEAQTKFSAIKMAFILYNTSILPNIKNIDIFLTFNQYYFIAEDLWCDKDSLEILNVYTIVKRYEEWRYQRQNDGLSGLLNTSGILQQIPIAVTQYVQNQSTSIVNNIV